MAIPVLSFITVSNNNSTVPSTCRFQNLLCNALRKNGPYSCSWRGGRTWGYREEISVKIPSQCFFLLSEKAILINWQNTCFWCHTASKAPWKSSLCLQLGNRYQLPWERGCVAVLGQCQQDWCETNIHSTNLLHIFLNLTNLQSISLLLTLLLPRA